MSKETVEVTVDAREPGKVFNAVDDHDEVEDWSITTLTAGDLKVGPVGFERKTITDYADSMMSDGQRQLEKQMAKMREEYQHRYILLDADSESVPGDMSSTGKLRHTAVRGSSLRGSMAKNTANGIPVIPCSNTEMLVDFAVRLARKHLEDSDFRYLSKGPVDVDKPTVMRMYGCLPGVGAETAQRMYEEWPSVVEFASVSKEELEELDGIGDKTAQRILSAMSGVYDRDGQ